jgi:hypothetical protein
MPKASWIIFYRYRRQQGMAAVVRSYPERVTGGQSAADHRPDAEGIPSERVTAFNQFRSPIRLSVPPGRSSSELAQTCLWAGKTFCRHVLRRGFGDARGIYVFNSAGLEVLEDARAAGRHRVIEQTIAPRRVEQDLLREEQERFPDWQTPVEDAAVIGDYCSREEAGGAWRMSSARNRASSRDGIARCGGPANAALSCPMASTVAIAAATQEPR